MAITIITTKMTPANLGEVLVDAEDKQGKFEHLVVHVPFTDFVQPLLNQKVEGEEQYSGGTGLLDLN